MMSPTLLLGIVFILVLLIYLSGNGKPFLLLFTEKLKNAELKTLKEADYALSFAMRTLPFISVFFMLMSVIYLYLNFFETQTLGINLSTVIDSILYLAQGEVLLLTLRGKLQRETRPQHKMCSVRFLHGSAKWRVLPPADTPMPRLQMSFS